MSDFSTEGNWRLLPNLRFWWFQSVGVQAWSRWVEKKPPTAFTTHTLTF
ncbi:MAG TPA: hypothetical protein VK203_16010 [Nostocaceae cyanobacterium]|nr:hypothetical protein [Nostocaceae cyanobacterium]